MKRTFAVVAVVMAGVWSLGLAPSHANPAAAPAAAGALKGKAAFEANCAACHQATGKGLPGAFPPLAGSDWLKGKKPSQVAEVVLKGLHGPVVVNGVTYNNVMPPQSGINDADIAAIVTYVLNQWGNPGGSISAEHGIGQLKREELLRYKSPLEMEMMCSVKRALDPQGLMNPGKVL